MVRTEVDGMPPDECFELDSTGNPVMCTQQQDGSWMPESVSSGPDPLAIAAAGFVLVLLAGVLGTAWRVQTARSLARSAGLDEAAAGRMAMASEDGLSATYLASSLRGPAGPAGPAPAVRDTATRLRELDRLRSEGLITEDEHAARRAGIINEV